MSIKVFGLAAFRAAIERGFVLAEFTEACLRKMPGWEIVTPAHMGIVCFRHTATVDAGHLKLVAMLHRRRFCPNHIHDTARPNRPSDLYHQSTDHRSRY